MDRDTAKTLSLIAMIFTILALVMMCLTVGMYLVVFIGAGAMMMGSGSSTGMISICCFILIFLGLLAIPAINLYFAYFKIYVPIRDGRYTDDVKKFLIAAIVLCFLGGGGIIPAVMYIVLVASWDELVYPRQAYGAYPAYPPYPQYPMYGAPPGQYPLYQGGSPPGAVPPPHMGQPPYRR